MFLLHVPGLLKFHRHVLKDSGQMVLGDDGFVSTVPRQESLIVDNGSSMFHHSALHVSDLVPIQPAVHQTTPKGRVYTASPNVEFVRNAVGDLSVAPMPVPNDGHVPSAICV